MKTQFRQNMLLSLVVLIDPLIPMSDQERISPYITNTISRVQVMRIKNKTQLGN